MIHQNLYSATYSGVAVYEFIHPKSSVMRRKKDGWVNATHILKVADFPKAKRTRILEKDVQTGIHEKVQGGYGKYQGTWVPLKRAIEIAQQFGVLNDLNPVFDYISNGSITPPPAPKHHHATSSNSKKQKALNNSSSSSSSSSTTTTNTKTKTTKPRAKSKLKSTDNLSNQPKSKRQKTNDNAKTNNNNTKKSIPAKVKNNENLSTLSINQQYDDKKKPPSLNISTNNNNINNIPSFIPDNNKSKRILKAPKILSNLNSNFNNLEDDLDDDLDDLDDDEINNNNNDGDNNNNNNNIIKNHESIYRRLHEPSTIEFMSEHDLDKALAGSETYGLNNNQNNNHNNNNNTSELNTLPNSATNNSNLEILDKSYVKALYNYFIETDSNPNCEMPYFITHQIDNFNINQPIDNQGNTLLHWACSMGDVKMCEILINRNCNIHVLNNKGEEPIVRSVIYANCYTKRTFNKLLNLLSNCLLDIDLNDRTLLHHIALATCDKNNLPSSRYYTEILLRKIAEIVNSNQTFKDFIDKKDIDGNTALHLFSFNNSKKCIKILLGYNARIDIRNNRNDQVGDYLTDNFKNNPINHSINLNDNINNSNEFYESFNLRPFNPSLNNYNYNNNNNNNSINLNKFKNSYMEPFQIQSLNNQNLYPNFNQSSIIGVNNNNNNLSNSSMKINQFSVKLFDKLNELSNAFDNEILQKNEDIKELNSIVKQMDNDINKTTNEIKDLVKSIIDSKLDLNNSNNLINLTKKIENQNKELSNDYNNKKILLKKMIDRSQAMDLAKIVQKAENDSLLELNNSNSNNKSFESDLSNNTISKLINLSLLQIIRKKTVNILVNIQTKSEFNNDILNNYRMLVSKLSNMPINEVDSSLNSIEECLRKENEKEEVI